MKVRRSELSGMKQTLEGIPRGPYAKFNYGVGKNLRKIKEEIRDLDDSIAPDEKLMEYEQKRVELCERYSKKKDGTAMMAINQDGTRRYQIDETKEDQFNRELEILKRKHKDALELQKKKVASYNQFIREDAEIEFHIINKEDVPEDFSPNEWEAILDWVVDETEVSKPKKKSC